jgi:N-methylhydantoinase A
MVFVSSELVPEYREYERFATTVLNAYVAPVMKKYLGDLPVDVQIMSSAGGQMSSREAAARPVHTLLSGPAGGAIATEAVCKAAGISKAISIDIGGTSADVALYDGALRITKEGTLGGFPIRVPILEIHTVGAGGGSIARMDAGGALRVGPESAGAAPGPACYGRGGRLPTVTDANVVLGRIDPALFFGGRLELDVEAARRALATLGEPRKAAAAVLDVVDATMERALRTVSVERGYDPEEFTLVPFGGAGPLHACSLAGRLNIRSILVPRWPGLFSALGMVLADEVREQSRTVLGRDVEKAFRSMRMPGRLEYFVDARYRGQSYEIRTPWRGDFHALHRRRYGFSRDEEPEIVNAIVRATVSRSKPRFSRIARGGAVAERPGVYRRERMGAGAKVAGPCLIMEDNATTYLARGWRCVVDAIGNLKLWR